MFDDLFDESETKPRNQDAPRPENKEVSKDVSVSHSTSQIETNPESFQSVSHVHLTGREETPEQTPETNSGLFSHISVTKTEDGEIVVSESTKEFLDSLSELSQQTDETKLSIETLFQRHLNSKSTLDLINKGKEQHNEEIVLFSKLDMNNIEDRKKWAKHLSDLADIAEEAKNRFAMASKLGRESDAKRGVTVWDRERRGTNALNGSLRLTDPRKAKEKEQEKQAKAHKAKLNKMELAIRGLLEVGDETEETLLEMFTQDGKYSVEQVKGMINRVKESLG